MFENKTEQCLPNKFCRDYFFLAINRCCCYGDVMLSIARSRPIHRNCALVWTENVNHVIPSVGACTQHTSKFSLNKLHTAVNSYTVWLQPDHILDWSELQCHQNQLVL